MSQLQALRRSVEGRSSAIAGAVGVRAQVYPHQLLNVWRVLSAPEIRHLIADEVGLGKTVQAIMIINAVRQAHPEEEIAVLVPDTLRDQWRKELLARGHESPRLEDSGSGAERKVSLLWPAILRRAADLDPRRFGLLVIDEIHNLTADLRDQVARTAADYNGVLLLSATPQLHDLGRRLELLAILEPFRVREAARLVAETVLEPPEGPLRRWPGELQAAVLQHLEQREAIASSASIAREACDLEWEAQRWSLQRKVLRARREDYGDLLPRREFRPLRIEPNEAEVQRISAVESYLQHDLRPQEVDAARLAQRASIGGPTLLARLGELIRGRKDAGGHLERAREYSGEALGDTRLDALCDLLNQRWLSHPDERVVVACVDNPTLDYVMKKVQARLDHIGPSGATRPLTVAAARRGEGKAEDLLDGGSAVEEAVAALQSGTAQVLFAGDIANFGLNLQCASTLIFYGLPWGPHEVEQWIGRLDRIGNVSTAIKDGRAGRIHVYSLSHSGLLDAHVESALSRFGVFERPIELEGDQAAAAHAAVAAAALQRDGALVEVACASSTGAPASPLAEHLPGGPALAMKVYEREQFAPPAEPALVHPSRDCEQGHVLRELALEGWLTCLDVGKEYRARYSKRRGYGTFWYSFEEAAGRRPLRTDVILPRLKDPGLAGPSPENSIAYITRRSDIEHPPRLTVSYTAPWPGAEPVDLPLQFMAHGGLVHDDLVQRWIAEPSERHPLYLKLYVSQHPALDAPGPGRYLISVGWIDPATHLLGAERQALPDQAPAEALRAYDWDLAADGRWLRDLLPAGTLCRCVRDTGGSHVEVDEHEAWALLKPLYHGLGGARSLPRCARFVPMEDAPPEVTTFAEDSVERLSLKMAARWAPHIDALKSALELRRTLIRDRAKFVSADLATQQVQVNKRAEFAEERSARIHQAEARALAQRLEAARALSSGRLEALEAAVRRAAHAPVAVFRTFWIDLHREVPA